MSNELELLRLPAVLKMVPFSRATLYRQIRVGAFPAPLALTERGHLVAWRSDEIKAWVESRKRGGRPPADSEKESRLLGVDQLEQGGADDE